MTTIQLDRIGAGDGPDVVLLIHSSGMSAGQWLRHIALLKARHRVIAPNLLGYGKNPPWDPAKPTADDDDLAALEALVAEIDLPIHLAGHSYGGTLAARLALAHPTRFSTLALFEPVLWGLLDPVADAAVFAELALPGLQENAPGSAEWLGTFVDYWSGPGAFAKMSALAKKGFLAAGPKMAAEIAGNASKFLPASDFAKLTLPALVAYGETTPFAGQAFSRKVAAVLPNAKLEVIAGAGHMAPMVRPTETVALLEALYARAAA